MPYTNRLRHGTDSTSFWPCRAQKFTPDPAHRGGKRGLQTPLLYATKVEEALMAGMERAQDTVAPVVHQHILYSPFVEDQLSTICAGRPCWLAEMGSALALPATPAGPAGVMIGPEGGFAPFELDLAQSVIAQPVHLGTRVLSVDTALTAALALGWG